MADDAAISGLGGFALSEVLSSLDPSLADYTLSGIDGLSYSSHAAGFSRDAIYNAKFMDDDDDDDDLAKDDLEDQVDKEMYDEKFTSKKSASSGKKLMRGEEDDFDDDDDEEEEDGEGGKTQDEEDEVRIKPDPDAPSSPDTSAEQRKQQKMLNKIKKRKKESETTVKDLFPGFEHGKALAFTDLFGTRPRKRRRKDLSSTVKLALPNGELPLARSTKDLLLLPIQPLPLRQTQLALDEEDLFDGTGVDDRIDESSLKPEEEEELELVRTIENSNRRTKSKWIIPSTGESQPAFSLPELDTWEDRIIWDTSFAPKLPPAEPLAPRNAQLDSGVWLKSIIWDKGTKYREWWKPELNLNDKAMLLEVVEEETDKSKAINPSKPIRIRSQGQDEFNLSNDKEYEVTRDAKKRIRQTFGLLEVVHAYPAQKLQLPFYKTRLTKYDARSFHRPPIQIPANIQLGFTKAKSAKKKKDPKSGRRIRKAEGAEGFRTMVDLSARDLGPFVIMEYSEENPPIISNVGMGSLVVNYYRKKDASDDFVPQLDIGQPFLLDTTDESPFKAYGFVDPGQTVPTMYNNMVRAPLFRHKPNDSDFLLVRTTIDGETKYYIREIKNLFVIGQTYPQQEVPGPHSRKISGLSKQRLQAIAYKLIAKNPKSRLKVNQLTRYFQDQNDLQMRQRLKEFMEFNRKGTDQGFWMLKPNADFLDPLTGSIRNPAVPEEVCRAESMQVGLRHLQDAGYGKVEEGGAGDDDSKLDIEQQLAPWNLTKNFVNAVANKARLALYGEGDPTGRGEGFSFLRVSMKEMFLRDGEELASRLADMESRPKSAHRFNVEEQHEVYKSEVSRIWKAQFDSLSSSFDPDLTQEDEDRYRGRKPAGGVAETPGSFAGTPWGTRPGTPGSRASSPDKDDGMSVGSGGGRGGGQGQEKILKIRRLVKGVWETEIVRDPGIIKAYVRQRQTIEDETDPDNLLPSNDEEKNARRKKKIMEQLEKLKKNQERRLARKNQKLGVLPGAIGVGGKKNVKTETTRVCGNCGQRGHMKTSKKLCPRWYEFNGGGAKPAGGGTPAAFGGGLAIPGIGGTPQASAASPPKLKLKLGGAMSPPQDAASPF